MQGDAARWGDQEHLLASILESLWAANWQRGGDKNAEKPKRITRPGEQPPKLVLPAEEMHRRLLDMRRRRELTRGGV